MEFFNWPWWLVLPLLLIAVGLALKTKNWLNLLPAALVLYFGTTWVAPTWLLWVFWILFLLGIAFAFRRRHGPSLMAFLLILGIVLVSFFRGSDIPSDVEKSAEELAAMSGTIAEQMEATDLTVADLNSMRTKVTKNTDDVSMLRERVIKLEKNDKVQDERLDNLEKTVESHSDILSDFTSGSASLVGVQQYVSELDADDADAFINQLIKSELVMTPTGSETTVDQAVEALAGTLVELGFTPDQIQVGTVDWSINDYDVGNKPFGDKPVTTRGELEEFLGGDNAASKAARGFLKEQVPADEFDRALSGEAHIPVQFLVDTEFSGNTYFDQGTAMIGGAISYAAGDVVWVYVSPEGLVNWQGSMRADCSNLGYTKPPQPVS